MDFWRRHLKRIRICQRSKMWWDADLTGQVKAVRHARRNWCRLGHRNVLRAEITKMKRMVRMKKDQCCRAFCEDSGLQSPWEVVRWARDPWREKERMTRLRGSNGVWLESEEDRVRCLVSEVFVVTAKATESQPWGAEGCPMSKEDLEESVRHALGRTKNGLAPGPYGISYKLIKAV